MNNMFYSQEKYFFDSMKNKYYRRILSLNINLNIKNDYKNK